MASFFLEYRGTRGRCLDISLKKKEVCCPYIKNNETPVDNPPCFAISDRNFNFGAIFTIITGKSPGSGGKGSAVFSEKSGFVRDSPAAKFFRNANFRLDFRVVYAV